MLDVHADVEILLDGGRGRLLAAGQHLELEIDQPSALVGLAGRRMLGAMATELARAGCTLRVRSCGRLLLVAGEEAGTGLVGRLLHVPHVRPSLRFALRYLVGTRRSTRRERPAARANDTLRR